MSRPFIQIGNETREMTEEEYASYLAVTSNAIEYPSAEIPSE